MNILIKQGRIITPNKDFIGDIYISNGKITNIDTHISGVQQNVIILDARNKLVIPGGIDAHVHMHLYTPAGYSSDDFYTGSLAALRGGTTSMIDFVTPNKHQSLIEALKERIKEANNALCNYRFHMSITSWDEHTAEEMKQCVEQYGIRSFKTYLAYKGSIGIEYDELEKVMQTAYKLNALVTVHAEEGDIILENQHKFIQNGQTSPYYHALSRPADVEAKAVEKVITLSEKTGCTTYIVHTSAADSIKKIKAAQKRGIPIYAETCPQYLLLNEQVYQKAIDEALKYVISPPIRNTTDQQELWKAIAEGVVSVIATDHCPFNTYGQKDVGLTNFTKIPNGAGGVEHRMALLYTYGVLGGKMTIKQWIELCCTNPAKIFGISPQKGVLEVGSDADIVIWNPDTENIISAKTHHQNCDSNIYEGFKIFGQAETVILNGKIISEAAFL